VHIVVGNNVEEVEFPDRTVREEPKGLEAILRLYGSQGWELAALVPYQFVDSDPTRVRRMRAVFKRRPNHSG